METSPTRARIFFARAPSVCATERANVKEAAFHEQRTAEGEQRAAAGHVLHYAVPNSCGPIAQWQSGRLITVWSQVRTLLGPPFAESITTDERDTGGARLPGSPAPVRPGGASHSVFRPRQKLRPRRPWGQRLPSLSPRQGRSPGRPGARGRRP